jgi:hypothetical protein
MATGQPGRRAKISRVLPRWIRIGRRQLLALSIVALLAVVVAWLLYEVFVLLQELPWKTYVLLPRFRASQSHVLRAIHD